MILHRYVPTAPLLVLVAGLAACGGSAGSGAFPSRTEIDAIAAAPLPSGGLDDRSVDVASWELRGPAAEAIDEATGNDPSAWGGMLAAATSAGPGLVASQAMGCVAREAAVFVAQKGALPAQTLRRFLAARCGAASTDVSLAYQAGTVPPAMTEADVSVQWGPQVRAMVQSGLRGGNRLAGIGFARANDHAAVLLATAPRRARLERTPIAASGGGVVLRGELLVPAAHIEAMVTSGRFGYAECAVDAAVALPRFSVACPVAAADASAWIEVAAFPAGRVLGDAVIDIQVFPAGAPDHTYAHAPAASRGGPRDPAALAIGVVEHLNAVRRDAGLGAVRLSLGESRKAAALAPHYFAALGGHGDVTVADKIALGLQAGWDVEGVVRDGHFATGRGDAQSPDDLLDQACASPFGRRALLDPEVQSVAVGTVVVGDVLGALIGTYAIVDPRRAPDESSAVLSRLSRLRQTKRLAAPTVVPQLASVLAKASERVLAGQDPADAMHWLLESAAEQARGKRVHVWVSQASTVERLDLPPSCSTNARSPSPSA